MMKKMILTAAAAAVVAITSVKAQNFVQIGEILPISSAIDASGSNITYDWFYSHAALGSTPAASAAVPGCSGVNAVSCIVPTSLTSSFPDGLTVNFYRRATAQDCAVGNTKNTTPITVTFVNVVMSGVRWANFNSTTPNTGLSTGAGNAPVFATGHNTADYRFWQFNRPCAWSTVGDAGTPCGAAWNSTPDPAANWNEATAPVCPTGWRMPTNAEVNELAANSNPVNGRWATAAQSGFPVNGAFFGPRANVCTSSDMGGCIFLPSGGERLEAAGALNGAGYWAFAWSSVQNSATTAHRLSLHTNLIVATNTYKARALPIRCVQ